MGVMFREGESRGREKEPTAAYFSAVAVNGGLQGGRRKWTGKRKRGTGEKGGERKNLGEPVAVDTAVWLPEGRDTKRLREERREIAGGGGLAAARA